MNPPAACEQGICQICPLRTSVLFAGIAPRLLAEVERDIIEQEFAAGDSLYHVGEPGLAAFTVRRGLIKLVQYLPDGTERIVRLVSATDVVGLEALLDTPYQHDAIAVQPVAVCRLPIDVLRRLHGEDPALHKELLRRWQRALNEADAWLTELSTGSARRRVARLLMRLVDEKGVGRCILFNRRDMGAMLGVTTESASRVIAEFKRAGLLDESASGFRIDVMAMKDIAEN